MAAVMLSNDTYILQNSPVSQLPSNVQLSFLHIKVRSTKDLHTHRINSIQLEKSKKNNRYKTDHAFRKSWIPHVY